METNEVMNNDVMEIVPESCNGLKAMAAFGAVALVGVVVYKGIKLIKARRESKKEPEIRIVGEEDSES